MEPVAEGPVLHALITRADIGRDQELGLQRERTFLAAVLDSVDVGVTAVDSQGRTVLFNKAMRRIWGTAEEPVQVSAWNEQVDIFQADGRTTFTAGQMPLARSLSGEIVRDLELVIASPETGPRRYLANAQPVQTGSDAGLGAGLGAVMALHDITDQRLAETARAVQQAVTKALSEAETTTGGLKEVLRSVCAVLGWAGGEYWQADADPKVISRVTSWWPLALAGSAVAGSGELTLARGEGLPGAVWAGGSQIWVGDLQTAAGDFCRTPEALEVGLTSALALPVHSGPDAGVLLFLGGDLPRPDPEQMTALEAVCAHVGRFVERRRAEDLLNRLAATRENLERMIGNVRDHLWTVQLTPQGQVCLVFSSRNIAAMFGGTPDQGTDEIDLFRELVHPDDRSAYQDFQQQMVTRPAAEIECRIVGLDGVTRWIWTRTASRQDGGRTLIDGMSADITERKQGEIELEGERRRLRQAQAIGRVGSWELNLDDDTLTYSPALLELYGVDPDRVGGREALHSCLHPEDADRLTANGRRCAATGLPFEARYRVVRARDGQLREFEARGEAVRGASGRVVALIGTAADISEQVQAQRELLTRQAMLRAVLANSQSLIYVKDLDGRYLMVNRPFERAFGVTEAELIGQDDHYLDPVLASTWRESDRLALQGEYTLEEIRDDTDGSHYYESVKFPLLDAQGRVNATCGISLDVTTRRRASEAMAEAVEAAVSANNAKSAFLATMSHEIRTPMNAVIGMTDLLLRTSLDPLQQEYAEAILTSGESLLAVINNILDFSKIEAGELTLEDEPFDLTRVVEDSLAVAAATARGLELVADVRRECPRFVRGDGARLRQVLVNLIGNAVKFTKQGDVLVTVAPVAPVEFDGRDTGRPTGTERPIDISFTVRDTGIGIPPDRMDRLFKAFSQVDVGTTRMYGGTGLGLAISQALVRRMGGDIRVTSAVGIGSSFAFTLPLDVASGGDPETATAPDGDLRGCRALVVDDNDTNRRILQQQLAGWSVSSVCLADPLEALSAIRAGATFDIAILDMNMPVLSGAELAELIRRQPGAEALPMILLSSLDANPHEIAADLFVSVHTKPVRHETLRTTIIGALAPALVIPVPRKPAGDGDDGAQGNPLRILLAEDNRLNQKVAIGILRVLGHTVDVVTDGEAAVRAALTTDYDVVLMDLHMPTMDGLEAARAIGDQSPAGRRRPYIIAMTASSLPEDRRAATEAGMNDYLLKPVRAGTLADVLRRVSAEVAATRRPAAAGARPAVDFATLRQTLAEMGADTAAQCRDLIEVYLEQSDAWIGDLSSAAQEGQGEEACAVAHALVSSSALIGALALVDLLQKIRPIVAAGATGLIPAVAAVVTEYGRVVATLSSAQTQVAEIPQGPGRPA